uniref:Uncharacterized protein n=1 Tax=Timema poppense TaxID=170557 RepID=A0A7R9CRA6_TIMPO|nr:unnamed protein product [Timema poppensis]
MDVMGGFVRRNTRANFYYDPKAVDCEEKNIEFFKKFAWDCGIPEESTLHSTVLALLQAASTSSTEEHKTPGVFGTDDLHYFLDLDMAILGSSPEHYVEYTSIVRREYAFLSDNMYRSLRLKTCKQAIPIERLHYVGEDSANIFRSRMPCGQHNEPSSLLSQFSRLKHYLNIQVAPHLSSRAINDQWPRLATVTAESTSDAHAAGRCRPSHHICMKPDQYLRT